VMVTSSRGGYIFVLRDDGDCTLYLRSEEYCICFRRQIFLRTTNCACVYVAVILSAEVITAVEGCAQLSCKLLAVEKLYYGKIILFMPTI
jgi:hypothetical protein